MNSIKKSAAGFFYLILISFLILACSGNGETEFLRSADVNDEIVEAKPVEEPEPDIFNLNEADFFDDPDDIKEIDPDAPLRTDSDVSSITVNYFNPEDFDMTGFIAAEDGSELEIIDFGPEGKLPNEMTKRPTIYVVFNKPMVPLSKLGDPVFNSPYMEVDPPIKGVFRWYGSKMLSFEPTDKVMPQREYSITIKDIKSLGGSKLKEDFIFSFYTEFLKFETVFPHVPNSQVYINKNDIPLEYVKKITVQLTYPFDLKLIRNYLTVKARGKEYEYKISRFEGFKENENLYNRTCVLKFKDTFPENAGLVVTLKKGARSYKDSLGRNEAVSVNLHTIKPFVFKNHSTYNYSYVRSTQPDSNPLYLSFSHPLENDPELVSKYITTSFDVPDMAEHIEIYGRTVRINNLPVEYESTYKVSISPEIKDIYGRKLGKKHDFTVSIGKARSYAYFRDRGFKMLEAQFLPQLVIEYQNIENAQAHLKSVLNPLSYNFPSYSKFTLNAGVDNKKHFQLVDLKDHLNSEGFGSIAMRYKFFNEYTDSYGKSRTRNWTNMMMLQVTDLGVTVRFAYNKAVVMVHSLSTGAAVSGADVELLNSGTSTGMKGKTDKDGLISIPIKRFSFSRDDIDYINDSYRVDGFIVKVTKGGDQVFYQPGSRHNRYSGRLYSATSPWRVEDPRYSVMLFTDRGLYKPGEELVFRGISQFRSTGDYQPSSGGYSITVDKRSYFRNNSKTEVMYRSEGTLTENGGFHHSFTIPETTAPDYYYIHYYKSTIEQAVVRFQVAEFKRAEFQVVVSPAETLFYAGDKVTLTGKADYLSGGAMAGAEYRYNWSRQGTSFRAKAPEFKNYAYGINKRSGRSNLNSAKGNLSGDGKVSMEQVTGVNQIDALPYVYTAELYVEDITRQELTGFQRVTVHPSEYYLGAKITSNEVKGWWSRYVKLGSKMDFEFIKVTPDEKKYTKNSEATAELIRREWKSSTQSGVYGRMNYRWKRVEVSEAVYDLDFGFKETLSVKPEKSGSYLLRITSEDSEGRKVQTEVGFYVTGSSWINWGLSTPEKIELIPDREEYSPGDTAQIFMKTPLAEGQYLITIEREGIYEERLIDVEGSAVTFEVPITEDHIPVIYVAICSSSERKETPESYYDEDMGKPRGYFGITALRVTTERKELKVEILPDQDLYLPGSDSKIRIRVTKDGKPVQNAEVTFLAADRGVLDLINYHVPNPIAFYYSPYRFPHAVYGGDSRSHLIDPITYELKDLAGGDKDELQKREDFRPLAIFEPFLKTDKDGIVEVEFELPDTLTTYRSTAFVVSKDEFGFSEKEVFVRNPITVRTAMPQAMRLRDTAEIGCILTNLSGKEYTVKVGVKSDILQLNDNAAKGVVLPPNATVEIPFKFTAVKEGEATIEFTVRSPVLNEILVQKLEVVHTVIKESFTLIGHTEKVGEEAEESGGAEDSAVEGFIFPTAVDEGYGGITVSLTTTPFPSVTNAINYFHYYNWHWGIYEKLIIAFPHMLFGETISQLAPGVGYSSRRQYDFGVSIPKYKFRDGGYITNLKYKDRIRESNLWFTMLVAQYEGLARVRDRGVLSNDAVNSMLNYLQKQYRLKHIGAVNKARILYLLAMFGRNVEGDVDQLVKLEEDALGMTGYLYCGLAYDYMGKDKDAQKLMNYCRKFIKVGTRTIDFVDTYEVRDYFDSQTHRLCMLDLLYYQQKGIDDMMITYSNTINKAEKHGYWGTATDTLWVLICAAEIDRQESTTKTQIDVSVNLSDKQLWETQFKGAALKNQTARFRLFDEPLASLKRDYLYPLSFSALGKGQLFYAATFQYALPAEIITARDEGLGVFREIYDLEGNRIESDKLVLGETYRMKVVISSSKTRYDVGLRVPVPSGCDVLDSSFVTTGSYSEEGGTDNREWTREMFYGDEGYAYYWGDWWFYSIRPHKRIYKNQVTYRFGHFYRGQQQIDFLFRATTPGTYPTPPAYAEVLDEPEVFGRSEGVLVIIE